jgi:hypothetical protein
MQTFFANLRNRSLAVRTAVLLLAVVLLWGLVSPVAWHFGGPRGLAAAAVAAGCCLLGAGMALVASDLLSEITHVLYGLLLGMFFRMGVPMGFALAIHFQRGELADAGVLYYLAVFYPMTLAVETLLSLPSSAQAATPGGTTRNSRSGAAG